MGVKTTTKETPRTIHLKHISLTFNFSQGAKTTVEPPVSGHPQDQKKCPLKRGFRLREVPDSLQILIKVHGQFPGKFTVVIFAIFHKTDNLSLMFGLAKGHLKVYNTSVEPLYWPLKIYIGLFQYDFKPNM